MSAHQAAERSYEKSIQVISVRGLKDQTGIEYVGRGHAGWPGSVLGNQFVIGKDGSRNEVIQKYRTWLWAELKSGHGPAYEECLRLAGRIRKGDKVVLGCWCKPLACHADIVKSAVLWLTSKR